MIRPMKKLLSLILLIALRAVAQEPAGEFRVTSAFPKYVTADLEFRDPSGAKWPNFFNGKPANDTGSMTFDPAKPAANFAVLCDKQAQDKGDQSRRVLGDLPLPLTAALSVTAMSPLQPAGKVKGSKATHTAELTGTLEIAGRKLPIKAQTGFWVSEGKGDEKNRALMLDGRCTVKAADLGLKSLPPAAPIEVRFGLTAYPPEAASAGKK